MLPKLSLGIVDVRDVAAAHITAMTSPKAPGNRYVTISVCFWWDDMAKMLDDEFRPLGYCVPTKVAPNFILKIGSWFDPTLKMIVPVLDKEVKLDNTKIREDFGFQFRDAKTTVVDMAYSLIDSGFVKATPKYKEMKNQQNTAAN